MKNAKINFIHFCEAASVDSLNKLSILGIFNRIFLPTVPNKFPKITIVISLSVFDISENGNQIKIQILDPQKKELVQKKPIVADFKIPKENIKEGKAELNLILEIVNVEFKIFGSHYVKILFDNEEIENKELKVERKNS